MGLEGVPWGHGGPIEGPVGSWGSYGVIGGFYGVTRGSLGPWGFYRVLQGPIGSWGFLWDYGGFLGVMGSL